jgi:hypothetical protein
MNFAMHLSRVNGCAEQSGQKPGPRSLILNDVPDVWLVRVRPFQDRRQSIHLKWFKRGH